MATALHLLRARTFPSLAEGQIIETFHQIGLQLPGEETDNDAHTTLERLGRAAYHEFDKYLGRHEDLWTVTGRFRGKPFKQVIVEERFEIFRQRGSGVVLGKGKRDVVFPALRRLRDAKMCDVEPVALDLAKLREGLKGKGAHVHGAHFNKLALAKLTAAAVFGEDVDQSEEFKHYEMAGFNSAAIISANVKGAVQKFMVTKTGTVVVYENWDEKDLLDFGEGVEDLTRFAQVPATEQ